MNIESIDTTSERFFNALLMAGVVRPGDLIARIVIEAVAGEPIRTYVERLGDERLIDVDWGAVGFAVTDTGGQP
jgi:hypothetical protein